MTAGKISQILAYFLFAGESVEFRKFAHDANNKHVTFKVEDSLLKNADDSIQESFESSKGQQLVNLTNSVLYKVKGANGYTDEAVIKKLR